MKEYIIPDGAMQLLNILKENGFEGYLVGGCVRDMYIGIEPKDFDICTNARPEETIELLKDNNIKFTTIGIDFGTVEALIGGEEFEITTYRADGEYTDNRRPDSVNYVTDIHKDLERRDFTINAMAFDPITGELIDDFGGLYDIDNGLIQAVGDAQKRFKEDALRVLRALRFSIKYGYIIEAMTLQAMKANVKLLSSISKERITNEFDKMLTCGKPVKQKLVQYYFIVEQLIPALKPCYKFNQNNKYHRHDVYEHLLCVVDNCKTRKFEIKLAALLHDIGKPESYVVDDEGHSHFYGHPEVSYNICISVLDTDFRLTAKQKDEVLTLIRNHDMNVAATKPSVKRALNKLGVEYFDDWCILKQADIDDHVYPDNKWLEFRNIHRMKELESEIIAESNCFSLKDLEINGKDLIKDLGLKPGKQIGIILDTLLNEVIDEKINNKHEELLTRAKKLKEEIN